MMNEVETEEKVREIARKGMNAVDRIRMLTQALGDLRQIMRIRKMGSIDTSVAEGKVIVSLADMDTLNPDALFDVAESMAAVIFEEREDILFKTMVALKEKRDRNKEKALKELREQLAEIEKV